MEVQLSLVGMEVQVNVAQPHHDAGETSVRLLPLHRDTPH